jgi:hypothetical protein
MHHERQYAASIAVSRVRLYLSDVARTPSHSPLIFSDFDPPPVVVRRADGGTINTNTVYDSIHQDNIASIRGGDVFVDEYLGARTPDTRRGLSLIIPLNQLTQAYEGLIKNFRILEPEQYYYPPEDLHITVFDYIVAHKTYQTKNSIEQTRINVTDEAVESMTSFPILFRGVVFSREARLV